MTDRQCNNNKLELFLDKYPFSEKLTSDQVQMIRTDVKRLSQFKLSKKAIDRLYHNNIPPCVSSFYGLSDKHNCTTFRQTCNILWQYQDMEEKQTKSNLGFFKRLMGYDRS